MDIQYEKTPTEKSEKKYDRLVKYQDGDSMSQPSQRLKKYLEKKTKILSIDMPFHFLNIQLMSIDKRKITQKIWKRAPDTLS